MSAIYDYTGSLHRMGDDPGLFEEMAGLLRADAPALLDAVQTAHQQGDAPRLERASHTLKGLAANFGASRAVMPRPKSNDWQSTANPAGCPPQFVNWKKPSTS